MEHLCDDYLMIILPFLGKAPLLSARLVSNKFNKLIDKDMLLKRIDTGKFIHNLLGNYGYTCWEILGAIRSIGYLICDHPDCINILSRVCRNQNVQCLEVLSRSPFHFTHNDLKFPFSFIDAFAYGDTGFIDMLTKEPFYADGDDVRGHGILEEICAMDNINNLIRLSQPPFNINGDDLREENIFEMAFFRQSDEMIRIMSLPPFNLTGNDIDIRSIAIKIAEDNKCYSLFETLCDFESIHTYNFMVHIVIKYMSPAMYYVLSREPYNINDKFIRF